jgi:hypothetical protein
MYYLETAVGNASEFHYEINRVTISENGSF